jgi:hypothetical protein
MAKLNNLKSWMCICSICFSTITATAQYFHDEDERTFVGGLTLGVNFSQVDGDNFAGFNKIGLNGGVVTYFMLDDRVAGSMELNYAQKGTTATKGQLPLSGYSLKTINQYSIDLKYLEVPLQVLYFDKSHSSFGAGVSYGALFGQSEQYNTVEQTKLYPFRRSDISALLSGNLKLTKHFFANFRFAYSLYNIRKDVPVELFHRGQTFVRQYTLRCMYLF